MSKDYPANNVRFKRNSIQLFERARNDETEEYHALKYHVTAVATGTDMESKPITKKLYLGAGQLTPWTPKATYQALMAANNLNVALANNLKDIYLDAINEDPST